MSTNNTDRCTAVSSLSDIALSLLRAGPSGPHESFDEPDNTAHVVAQLVIGETQNSEALKLELDVSAPVRRVFPGFPVLVAIDFHDTLFVDPNEIESDRIRERAGLIGMVPGSTERPVAPAEYALQHLLTGT